MQLVPRCFQAERSFDSAQNVIVKPLEDNQCLIQLYDAENQLRIEVVYSAADYQTLINSDARMPYSVETASDTHDHIIYLVLHPPYEHKQEDTDHYLVIGGAKSNITSKINKTPKRANDFHEHIELQLSGDNYHELLATLKRYPEAV
jgi:hypothetical protein